MNKKPCVYVNGECRIFPTYREIKKVLPALIKEDREGYVGVYRTRRGQWGEWFEKWRLDGKRAYKFKEGWM